MQSILDLLEDPLVWSVLVGFGLYIPALGGARFFSGVFARHIGNDPNAIEIGATRAWRLVIILHLILVTILISVLSVRAHPDVSDWSHLLWYLLSYSPFLIIDVLILISLSSHSRASKKAQQEHYNDTE